MKNMSLKQVLQGSLGSGPGPGINTTFTGYGLWVCPQFWARARRQYYFYRLWSKGMPPSLGPGPASILLLQAMVYGYAPKSRRGPGVNTTSTRYGLWVCQHVWAPGPAQSYFYRLWSMGMPPSLGVGPGVNTTFTGYGLWQGHIYHPEIMNSSRNLYISTAAAKAARLGTMLRYLLFFAFFLLVNYIFIHTSITLQG